MSVDRLPRWNVNLFYRIAGRRFRVPHTCADLTDLRADLRATAKAHGIEEVEIVLAARTLLPRAGEGGVRSGADEGLHHV